MSSEVDKLAQDVSYLQKDMAVVGSLVDRLDATIDKLTDISNSVSNLLAVHETKLTAQELINKQLSILVESRRVETDEKFKEMNDKIDDQYDDIMREIKEMRAESATQHNTLSDRITTMEKWQWTALGGSAVVGALLALIPWSSFF